MRQLKKVSRQDAVNIPAATLSKGGYPVPTIIISNRRAKFNAGDKVQVNGRCPKYILEQIRHNRLRTIVGVHYDADRQCCYYTLGSNHWTNSMDNAWVYFFRSYQLHKPVEGRKAGRPRQKRSYNRRIKCTIKPQNQYLGDPDANQSSSIIAA